MFHCLMQEQPDFRYLEHHNMIADTSAIWYDSDQRATLKMGKLGSPSPPFSFAVVRRQAHRVLMQRPPPAVGYGAASPPPRTKNWRVGRNPKDFATALPGRPSTDQHNARCGIL